LPRNNYFFLEVSVDILLVVSVDILLVVSVDILLAVSVLMVVESVVVLSDSVLLLQAASTAVIAKIANNFFIVLFLKLLKNPTQM